MRGSEFTHGAIMGSLIIAMQAHTTGEVWTGILGVAIGGLAYDRLMRTDE